MRGIQIRTAFGEAERVLFLGATRGGKTTLEQVLLRQLDSWVVFDSKRVGREWASFAAETGAVITQNPADIRRHERVVFQTDTRSLQDRPGWSRPGTLGYLWTEALLSVFWRQADDASTVAVFDEAMHTLPANGAHPEARRLFTQGAGMGLPCWLGSQAPLWIDTVAQSQSEHCFSFCLHHPGYRKELSSRRGVDCELLGLLAGPRHPDASRRREFAHHLTGDDFWTELAPLRLPGKPPAGVESVTTSEPQSSPAESPEADLVTLPQPSAPGMVGP